MIDLVSLLIGFLAGGLVLGGVALSFFFQAKHKAIRLQSQLEAMEGSSAHMQSTFAALAHDALNKSNEEFLKLAAERLANLQKESAFEFDKRSQAIQHMVKPVESHLDLLRKSLEQMQGTKQALQDEIRALSGETKRLTGALKNPTAQGKWGEFVLERLLEKANLIKGVHYKTQSALEGTGGSLRPDVIIYLQDNLHVVVDAKTPVNDFAEALDHEMNEGEFAALKAKLAKSVRERINDLSKKAYQDHAAQGGQSPDFTVLFMPSEYLFSLALQADPELIDLAADKQVVIASPTLMMSLLRVVGLSWRQVEMAKNAQEIAGLGTELYKRLGAFTSHMAKIKKGLESANKAYNGAVGSLESNVLPQARKFKDLNVAPQTASLEDLSETEEPLRQLHAPEAEDALDDNLPKTLKQSA